MGDKKRDVDSGDFDQNFQPFTKRVKFTHSSATISDSVLVPSTDTDLMDTSSPSGLTVDNVVRLGVVEMEVDSTIDNYNVSGLKVETRSAYFSKIPIAKKLAYLVAVIQGIVNVPSMLHTFNKVKDPEDTLYLLKLYSRTGKVKYVKDILEEIDIESNEDDDSENELTLLNDFIISLNNTGVREGIQSLCAFTTNKRMDTSATGSADEEWMTFVLKISLRRGITTLIRAIQTSMTEIGYLVASPSHLLIHITREESSYLIPSWEKFSVLKYMRDQISFNEKNTPDYYNLCMVICHEPHFKTYTTYVRASDKWIKQGSSYASPSSIDYYSYEDVSGIFARQAVLLLYVCETLTESEVNINFKTIDTSEDNVVRLNTNEEKYLPFLIMHGEESQTSEDAMVIKGTIQQPRFDTSLRDKDLWNQVATHLCSLIDKPNTPNELILSEQELRLLQVTILSQTMRSKLKVPETRALVSFSKIESSIRVDLDEKPKYLCRVCLQPSKLVTSHKGTLKKRFCRTHGVGRVKYVVCLLKFNELYSPRMIVLERRETNYRAFFMSMSAGQRRLIPSGLVETALKVFESIEEAEKWLIVLKVTSFIHHSVVIGKRSDYLISNSEVPRSFASPSQQDHQDMELLLDEALALFSVSISVNRGKVAESVSGLLNSEPAEIQKYLCRPKLNRNTAPGSKFKCTYSLVFPNIGNRVNGYLPGRNSHGEKVCSDHRSRKHNSHATDLYSKNIWPRVQVSMYTVSDHMLEVLESSLQIVYFLASCLQLDHALDETKVLLLNRKLEFHYRLPLNTKYLDYLNLCAATEIGCEFQFQKLKLLKT